MLHGWGGSLGKWYTGGLQNRIRGFDSLSSRKSTGVPERGLLCSLQDNGNRTGILKRECLHVLKTQGSEGARSRERSERAKRGRGGFPQLPYHYKGPSPDGLL